MRVTTRAARQTDLPALVRLGQQVHDKHVDISPARFKKIAEDDLSHWIEGKMETTEASYLVAEIGDKVVGYLRCEEMVRAEDMFRRPCGHLEVDQICVDGQARRQGAALALIEAAANLARGRGLAQLELNVWSENDRAQAAFEALGFDRLMERMARGIDTGADED